MTPAVQPEELHQWYLDATSSLNEEYYNKHAQKPYAELAV